LGIWWPKTISNKELWETTQQIPISNETKMRKWKWIGYTLRKDQNNITRQGLDWNPQEKRTKGRRRVTWKRTVLTELQEQNVSWTEAKQMAKNKSLLAKICDGPMFCLGTTGNGEHNIPNCVHISPQGIKFLYVPCLK
jgi:hypothetical protein